MTFGGEEWARALEHIEFIFFCMDVETVGVFLGKRTGMYDILFPSSRTLPQLTIFGTPSLTSALNKPDGQMDHDGSLAKVGASFSLGTRER